MPKRIRKALLLMFALGLASIFAAGQMWRSHDRKRLFECDGGNSYFFESLNAYREENECLSLLAKLSTGESGVLSIENFHHILPINDPAFPFLKVWVFSKADDDGHPTGLEGYSIAGLKFDGSGLGAAPAPLAPGYYVGDPQIWKEPGGNPLLFGCTDHSRDSAGNIYAECGTAYRLKNGDTLSYEFSGVRGPRPTNWADIDKTVRDLVEAAEQSALSRSGKISK